VFDKMPKRIAGSVIVITGASSGIGRASALTLARAGATVVVTSRREEVLRKLAEQCERIGGKALAIAADVTDQQAVQNLARQAIERFGRIDVWINNAAVTLFARLEDAPPDAYRRVIETNLFGCIHGARAVLPYFREQGSGILINISSGIGKMGSPFVSAYAASKFAIVGFSESLRMELPDAPNIHVCTVLPAAIDTPLFQQGANFTGRAVKPIPPVYSAEKVAHAIADLVRHPRREVIVGAAAKAGLMMHVLAPALTEQIFAKQVERKHFEDRPARHTERNLFNPMEYESISGGWRGDAGNRRFSNEALLAAAAWAGSLGLLIASRWLRRHRFFKAFS
jgi:short-subunit dehydrogenase